MWGSKSCTTTLDRIDTEKQLVWKPNSKLTLRENQSFGKPEQQKLIKKADNTHEESNLNLKHTFFTSKNASLASD